MRLPAGFGGVHAGRAVRAAAQQRPGFFQCDKGWKEGDTLRFVSEEYGKELTLEKVGDDYFIRSFTAVGDGG